MLIIDSGNLQRFLKTTWHATTLFLNKKLVWSISLSESWQISQPPKILKINKLLWRFEEEGNQGISQGKVWKKENNWYGLDTFNRPQKCGYKETVSSKFLRRIKVFLHTIIIFPKSCLEKRALGTDVNKKTQEKSALQNQNHYLKLAEKFKSVLQTIKIEFSAYHSLMRKFWFQ